MEITVGPKVPSATFGCSIAPLPPRPPSARLPCPLSFQRDTEAKIQDVPQCLNSISTTPMSPSTLLSCFREESVFLKSQSLHLRFEFHTSLSSQEPYTPDYPFSCDVQSTPPPQDLYHCFKYFTVSSHKVSPPPSHL